jgi:integrase/recombinase XerD
MVFNIVKKQCSLVGIKKNVSPHTFRHSFASHLLARGADLLSIQLLLGHENLTTTEIYLHLDKSKIKDILEEYHPRAKN